jgi:hypothetical protein
MACRKIKKLSRKTANSDLFSTAMIPYIDLCNCPFILDIWWKIVKKKRSSNDG